MKLLLSLSLLGALAGCTAEAADPVSQVRDASATGLTVVELYQSQGCSSCPPAVRNVNALANRPDVLPLMFSVTYWDRLGWRDTFGDPAFTQRQWDYARHAGRPRVFTPQVVVNGGPILVGDVAKEIDAVIRRSGLLTGGPAIAAASGAVTVGAGRTQRPLTVWLVRYDPRSQQVAIGAGENSGRTIAHRNVVRQLVNLGRWSGQATRFTAPASRNAAYNSAVLLQADTGGPIKAAKRI